MKKSFLILVSLYIIAFGNTFANQNVVTGDSAVAEIIHPENTSSDGPYIYRHSDSMAIVLYFCDGAVTTDSFSVIDTLKFRGLCADSLNEYIIPFVVHSVPPAEYQNVSKIFAISDIHGEYEMMVDILRNGGVIDDKLLWTWATGIWLSMAMFSIGATWSPSVSGLSTVWNRKRQRPAGVCISFWVIMN